MPHWLKDRYIELPAKYWATTRARLDAVELAADLGLLGVPPRIDQPAAEEQSTTE